MALGEGDRRDPVLQHCHQPKGGGFCWKLRWSMAVTALRTTLGFGGRRVEKWHLGGKLFRAALPFTVASLRAGALSQKQHFTTSPLNIQVKLSSNWVTNGIIQKKASHPSQGGPLVWESGKSDSCSKAGQLKSFQTLVFLPEVAAASFFPTALKD